MSRLTSKQRIQIVVQWIRRGGKDYMEKEAFIEKVCKAMNIEYVAPGSDDAD